MNLNNEEKEYLLVLLKADDNNFEIRDSIIKKLEKKSRTDKRFRIDLQPTARKLPTHYTDHLIDYLNFNIRTWHHWYRLPITITDNLTKKQLIINNENWWLWRKLVKEWLE